MAQDALFFLPLLQLQPAPVILQIYQGQRFHKDVAAAELGAVGRVRKPDGVFSKHLSLEHVPWRRMTSLVLVAAFLLMGFTFTITQGVFVREFLVAFTGNELSIGLLLASWLLLEALGSGFLGRLADRIRNALGVYAALQVILSLCFLPALTLTYLVRGFLGVIPGEGIGFLPILYSTFLILAPWAS